MLLHACSCMLIYLCLHSSVLSRGPDGASTQLGLVEVEADAGEHFQSRSSGPTGRDVAWSP